MGLRGRLETDQGVDADGNPVRYQWGAYDGMQKEWMTLSSIWVVPQKFFKSFCPFPGTEAFFILPENTLENEKKGVFIPSIDEKLWHL